MQKAIRLVQTVAQCETVKRVGRVVQFYGLVVESNGPDVYLGEICEITTPAQRDVVCAEVVGVAGDARWGDLRAPLTWQMYFPSAHNPIPLPLRRPARCRPGALPDGDGGDSTRQAVARIP